MSKDRTGRFSENLNRTIRRFLMVQRLGNGESDKFNKTMIDLANHYDKLVNEFGNNVKSSQQSNILTRKKRLEILTQYIDIKKKKLYFRFWLWNRFSL